MNHALPENHAAPSPVPHRILIVDDEPDLELLMRQRFRRAIRSGELEFVFAHNGAEALEKLNQEPDIPVVMTDINMPQMDGLTLLGKLEERNEQAHHAVTKAVVVSAYGDMQNIRTAMNRGAFDFLTKPIDFGDVEITLQKTLQYVEQVRESRRAEEYRIAKETVEESFLRLQQLEQLRDSLVHMIVHDLRTPLTSFSAGLQLLQGLGELNDVQQECLQISMTGAQTLLGMVNDLLDVSKMEAGQLQLQIQELSPHDVVQRALAQTEFLARDKTIRLEHDIALDLPALHADEEKLARVLVNLMGNAIKFTPAGGSVSLSVCRHENEDALHFCVADTGKGIPAEAFETIFEKFGQAESGQSGHHASTGLGLTFCKMAVEAHAGRIWVESTIGQGSRFSFTLPYRSTQA
jgi:signal transduction histidine kinase